MTKPLAHPRQPANARSALGPNKTCVGCLTLSQPAGQPAPSSEERVS